MLIEKFLFCSFFANEILFISLEFFFITKLNEFLTLSLYVSETIKLILSPLYLFIMLFIQCDFPEHYLFYSIQSLYVCKVRKKDSLILLLFKINENYFKK